MFATSLRRICGSVVHVVFGHRAVHRAVNKVGTHFFGLGSIKIMNLSCCGALECLVTHVISWPCQQTGTQSNVDLGAVGLNMTSCNIVLLNP